MLKTKGQQVGQTKRIRLPIEGSFCSYSHRPCMHNRLDSYDFCIRHILEDKNAPFKQCGFVSSKNGKRCPNAAPKMDRKDGYCSEHARRAIILRQRQARKPQQRESAELLLEQLDHFKNTDSYHIDNRRNKGNSESLASKVLECASSSDSDTESPLVDQAWRGDLDSDAESIDSDQEDPLKHAGVYTAEEVALIMRDKLIRLQSLYIDQFKRLQHVMSEKRRKYLHTHRREKETLGSLLMYKDKPETRDKYVKLKALKRYHKRFGKEALLHRQSKQRRIAVSEGQNYRPPLYAKCVYVHEGTKCTARALPLSKYCSHHILNDPFQVLYRPCKFGQGKCYRSVLSIQDEPYCSLHTTINPSVTRIPIQSTEEETETADIINSKDILQLENLGLRDPLMAQHLLSRNPQLPESIFSGSESDITESASTSNCGPDRHSVGSSHESSDAEISRNNACSDPEEKKKMAYGPLLLQHLQGKVDLTNIHRRRVPPAPSTSSPSDSSSVTSSTTTPQITPVTTPGEPKADQLCDS